MKRNEVKNYFDGLRGETDGRITKSIQGLVLNLWGTEVKKERNPTGHINDARDRKGSRYLCAGKTLLSRQALSEKGKGDVRISKALAEEV